MKNYGKRILLAALMNLVLFSVFLFFTRPIYNTEEDLYILYTLSGSFGSPPSFLLHYNYGFHPLLGYFLTRLFLFSDRKNWYSLMLLSFHYVSCCIILSLIIIQKSKLRSIFLYFLLFIIFEGRLLLNIKLKN